MDQTDERLHVLTTLALPVLSPLAPTIIYFSRPPTPKQKISGPKLMHMSNGMELHEQWHGAN